jgi:hypothetical protein
MGLRIVLALIGAALLMPVQASGQTRPTLRIVASFPLTLRASHFQPRERVRVSVVMGERTLSRRLLAGASGGFTVRFVGSKLNYCALPLVITARGPTSGLVRARIPVVDCAQP